MESLAPHITRRLAAFIEASSRVIVSGVKHPPHGEISRLPDSAAISSIQLIELVALTVVPHFGFLKALLP